MNPLKANMVKSAGDYRWSSFHHNALGVSDELITVHQMYMDLGVDWDKRQSNYVALFGRSNSEQEEKEIGNATQRGEVLGSASFHKQIGVLLSRSTTLTTHGGDRKSEVFVDDQAG